MAYSHRKVWFDQKGAKHVAYLSMGDDASGSTPADPAPASSSTSWLSKVPWGIVGAVFAAGVLFGQSKRS